MGLFYGCLIFIFGLQLKLGLCGITESSDVNTDESLPPINAENQINWPFVPKGTTGFNHRIQSPIDVILTKIKHINKVPGLEKVKPLKIWEPSDTGDGADVYNTGETVKILIKEKDRDKLPYMEFGPLENKFLLEQMHFHWGKYDDWGSEHMIDGEVFAVEIHMVHFNQKYKDVAHALDKSDGVAVLTIFGQTADHPNELLDPLTAQIDTLHQADVHHNMKWDEAVQWANSGIKLNSRYYTYPGSLTTYPFTENVAFILLPDPITLSHEQLEKFRGMYHKEGEKPIVENKRRIQPLNHRPVFEGPLEGRRLRRYGITLRTVFMGLSGLAVLSGIFFMLFVKT